MFPRGPSLVVLHPHLQRVLDLEQLALDEFGQWPGVDA